MSKKKKVFGAEYLFAALTLIIAVFVIGRYFTHPIVVSDITVQGNRFAGTGNIIGKSGLSEGMHGDSIAFLDIIQEIETLPWIASAHINLTPSGQVRIRVKEERPMALLVDDAGSSWVTESGIKLPVVLGKAVDVPILHGFDAKVKQDTLASEAFQKVRLFLTEARQDPGVYVTISEVMFTDSDGVVALTDQNAVRLTFGHDHYEERIQKWKAFQAQIVSEKGIDQIRSLDFRFSGQIVAKES